MKRTPFCRECIFYGGRVEGKGICNQKENQYISEHITDDFWCINGIRKGCVNCEHEGSWSDRCKYCKAMWWEMGEYSEWETKRSME